MTRIMNLHLISDSTGETLSSISRAVLSQFSDVSINEYNWYLIRTNAQIDSIIENLEKNPGFVIYTILEEKMKNKLLSACASLNIICVPAISHIVERMSIFLGKKQKTSIGRQHEITPEYLERMEAVNYTLSHDDGNLPNDLEEADIIILGASRTSKTPVSIYLSYKGYKVVNIPFVTEELMPKGLDKLKNPLVVSFVIDPERLESIRKTRMKSINVDNETDYTNLKEIKDEILRSRKFFVKINSVVINVTQKSVEETSVRILQLMNKRKIEMKNS
jgi:regulator of PEP synthase PpsR (kinase-PPPase family)